MHTGRNHKGLECKINHVHVLEHGVTKVGSDGNDTIDAWTIIEITIKVKIVSIGHHLDYQFLWQWYVEGKPQNIWKESFITK